MTKLYQKLFNLQSKIGTITKDAENPFFKSKYFDINGLLAELKPLLTEEKLVILQALSNIDSKPALETTIIDVESGESKVSTCSLPENSDPQKMGSIITYFRRYTLTSLLLLQAEDDDANNASHTTSEPKQQRHEDITPEEMADIDAAFGTSTPDDAVHNAIPFKSADKIKGQLCPQCNKAKIVQNPNTGKLFCEAKCWLNK